MAETQGYAPGSASAAGGSGGAVSCSAAGCAVSLRSSVCVTRGRSRVRVHSRRGSRPGRAARAGAGQAGIWQLAAAMLWRQPEEMRAMRRPCSSYSPISISETLRSAAALARPGARALARMTHGVTAQRHPQHSQLLQDEQKHGQTWVTRRRVSARWALCVLPLSSLQRIAPTMSWLTDRSPIRAMMVKMSLLMIPATRRPAVLLSPCLLTRLRGPGACSSTVTAGCKQCQHL